jgi:hypothetical protein
MKIGSIISLLVISFGFSACTDEDQLNSEVEQKAELYSIENLNIIYGGRMYSNIPTVYDNSGEFVFLDTEFSYIFESELKGLNSLSIHLVDDNTIEMYKSLSDNLDNHGILAARISSGIGDVSRTDTSSGENFIGSVDLYDDKKFKDTHWQFGIISAANPIWISNLGSPYKFNDKCSSLILTNNLPNDATKELNMGSYTLKYSEATLVFIGYDDKGYSDRTFTTIANPSTKKEWKELKNFNDKMSSFKLFFAQTGIYTTEGASK